MPTETEQTAETTATPPTTAEAITAATGGEPPQAGAPAPAGDSPAPAADERMARSYEDLVRQDRELQARRERLRADENDLKEWRRIREQASKDPGAALRALGIDPFQLGDRLLGIEPTERQKEPPKDYLSRAEAEQLVHRSISHQQQVWQQQQSIAQMIHASDHEILRDQALRNPQIVSEIYDEAVRRFQESNTLPDIPAMLAEREAREEATLFASIDKVLALGKVKARYGQLISGKETPTAPPKTYTGAPQTLSQQHKEEPHHEERRMTMDERWAAFDRALKEGVPEGWKDDEPKL